MMQDREILEVNGGNYLSDDVAYAHMLTTINVKQAPASPEIRNLVTVPNDGSNSIKAGST